MDSGRTRRGRRKLLGWFLLAAATLMLASGSEAVFARATAPSEAGPAPISITPATAALADGDGIRAHFLAELDKQTAASH